MEVALGIRLEPTSAAPDHGLLKQVTKPDEVRLDGLHGSVFNQQPTGHYHGCAKFLKAGPAPYLLALRVA